MNYKHLSFLTLILMQTTSVWGMENPDESEFNTDNRIVRRRSQNSEAQHGQGIIEQQVQGDIKGNKPSLKNGIQYEENTLSPHPSCKFYALTGGHYRYYGCSEYAPIPPYSGTTFYSGTALYSGTVAGSAPYSVWTGDHNVVVCHNPHRCSWDKWSTNYKSTFIPPKDLLEQSEPNSNLSKNTSLFPMVYPWGSSKENSINNK